MCDSASDVCAINRLQARGSAQKPTVDRRKTAKTSEERLNRTRERNRNAQRRYREKQKEQIDSLELQIENLGVRKAQAIAVRDQLQAERHALLDRLVSTSPNMPPSQRCKGTGAAAASRAPRPALTQPIAASKAAPSRHLRPAAHSPSDTLPAPPAPTKHGSLVRTRHTSADLYARRSLLPPPISSFRHHATLSYEDFRAASGTRSRVIDLSSMGFQDVVQAAQSATAQRLGCNQADVCWFVQYQYEVEPGVPLSFSTCLSSPECVASLVLGTVIAQLEAAVLGSTRESMHHFSTAGAASADQLSPGGPAAPSADSAGHAEPTSKRMCHDAQHTCTSSAASAHSADADHMHEVHPHDPPDHGGPDLMHDGDAFACDGGPQDEKPCMHEFEEWLDSVFDDKEVPSVGDAMGGRSDACMDSPPAGGDEPAATPPGESFFVRGGLRGLFDGRTAVRAVMLQAVRSMAQHSTADVDTVLSLITACWNIANETVDQYDTRMCECAARAGASAGESGAPQRSAVAGGTATDRPAHPAAQDAAASDGGGGSDTGFQVKGSGDALSLLPAGSGGSEGTGVDAEEFARQCNMSDPADRGAGGESAMRAASSEGPRVAEGVGSKGRGHVGVGGTVDADEEANSEAYHMKLTHTLCHVLRVIRDMCTEVCDAWRAGRIEALIGPLPAAASEERRQEQVFITLTDLCAGHALTVHDAGRIMRAMATNNISMSLRQYEVENAHVKFYRDLRLSADQRAHMAAWWHSWLRQKCGIDASASAARSILDSLPDTVPLPQSHLSHISRVADGLTPPRTCAACAARHHDAAGTCGHDSNMHGCDACSAKEQSSVAVYKGGGAPGVCGGCGGPADEDAGAGPLGCDAGSTCRAAEAVRLLVRMHDADGALSARALPMHQQPGELLDAEQLAWVCRKNLVDGCPMMDNLVLCQLAATQLRRQELYRWPAILGQPLPERM